MRLHARPQITRRGHNSIPFSTVLQSRILQNPGEIISAALDLCLTISSCNTSQEHTLQLLSTLWSFRFTLPSLVHHEKMVNRCSGRRDRVCLVCGKTLLLSYSLICFCSVWQPEPKANYSRKGKYEQSEPAKERWSGIGIVAVHHRGQNEGES